MRRSMLVIGAIAFVPLLGFAEANFLEGDELKAAFLTKPIVFVRTSDGQKISWDVRSDGNLYGRNLTRGSSDRATWEQQGDKVCVKWMGNSKDNCVGMVRDGETSSLYTGSKDKPKTFGTVEK